MKYLGVDYGSKRVGLAVSDHTESFALPLRVISDFIFMEDVADIVVDICMMENIDEIVIGESRDFSGNENEIMNEIKPFVHELKTRLDLPVRFHPEFLTSLEAERLQGKNDMHDASAAALILKYANK
jgi:putative Holliday junction resolvase